MLLKSLRWLIDIVHLVSSNQLSEVKSVKMIGRDHVSIILVRERSRGGGSGCGVEMARTPYLLMTIDDFRSVSCLVVVR